MKQLLTCLLLSLTSFGADVKLAWDANPEPEVNGYNLYVSTNGGAVFNRIPCGNVTSFTYSNVVSGVTHTFYVTAVNLFALESVPSAQVVYTATPDLVRPSITVQPMNVSVRYGQFASFSAAASGSQPLSWQWFRNSVAIPGATDSTLTIPSATLADQALYFARVSNAAGSTQTFTVSLTLQKIPPGQVKNLHIIP
jgi:hypothetical protein